MKKFYLCLFLLGLLLNMTVSAQIKTSEGDPSSIMIGYSEPMSQIYQHDGIGGVDYDANVGCALKITKEMLSYYSGAKITALNIGWSDPEQNGSCKFFIRRSLNGEDIASGEATIKFGWNEVKTNVEYVIPDNPEDLYVGYFMTVPANTICIPTFYPRGIKESCLLWKEGESDKDGNKLWSDRSADYGILAIQVKVEDGSDKFYNMVEVQNVNYYRLQVLDEKMRFDFTLKNRGMNEIEAVTTQFELNGKKYEEEVPLPSPLFPGCLGEIRGTMKALGSGTTAFKVTKLDGVQNKMVGSADLDIITVERSVADKYKRTPVIEFFESESVNIVPKYYNEFFLPGFEGYEDKMILLEHHVGDGLTIGDDESLGMMLDFVDNDSMLVSIPSMMLDRTNYVDMPVKFDYAPMFSILFPDFARPMYDFAINMPTFADVSLETTAGEGAKKGTVTVSGNIEENVLPAGEHLNLVVYLAEKTHESAMQLFLDQEEKDMYCNPETGKYPHHNVLSHRLTPMLGEQLDVESGSFSKTFDYELNEKQNADNMYVVAMLTRGGIEKDRYTRYVINSAKKDLTNVNAIDDVCSENDVKVSAANGRVVVTGNYRSFDVYDIAGAEVGNGSLSCGIYIVKVDTINGVKTFKIFIN